MVFAPKKRLKPRYIMLLANYRSQNLSIDSGEEAQFYPPPLQPTSVINGRIVHVNFNATYTDVALGNTVVLCAGLYGTSPHKNMPEAAPYAERYAEYQFVNYSASASQTEFEFGPYTFIPGEDIIDFRFFKSATDEDVVALLALGQGEKK